MTLIAGINETKANMYGRGPPHPGLRPPPRGFGAPPIGAPPIGPPPPGPPGPPPPGAPPGSGAAPPPTTGMPTFYSVPAAGRGPGRAAPNQRQPPNAVPGVGPPPSGTQR